MALFYNSKYQNFPFFKYYEYIFAHEIIVNWLSVCPKKVICMALFYNSWYICYKSLGLIPVIKDMIIPNNADLKKNIIFFSG